MQYRKVRSNGDNLSILGYGCMRFPTKKEEIDQEYVNKLIEKAFNSGINYFDTAFVYKNSEVALGIALKRLGKRGEYKIATKLPRWQVKETADFNKYFGIHLERLQTNYIDYYLIHCLYNFKDWQELKKIGAADFISEKLASGQIKNIGFSFHGSYDEFCKIVDDYDWNFCMLQYNLLDEFNQATYKGIDYAYDKGLTVFVMEPLKGGKLIKLMPKFLQKEFDDLNKLSDKNYSVASWGLRFVWNNPKVTLLLSGMSSDDQLEDNLNTANSFASLTDAELATLKQVQKQMLERIKVGCTSCNYCEVCPQDIDISMLMDFYNDAHLGMFTDNKATYGRRVKQSPGMDTKKCIACRKCEEMCPQGIKIADILDEMQKEFA